MLLRARQREAATSARRPRTSRHAAQSPVGRGVDVPAGVGHACLVAAQQRAPARSEQLVPPVHGPRAHTWTYMHKCMHTSACPMSNPTLAPNRCVWHRCTASPCLSARLSAHCCGKHICDDACDGMRRQKQPCRTHLYCSALGMGCSRPRWMAGASHASPKLTTSAFAARRLSLVSCDSSSCTRTRRTHGAACPPASSHKCNNTIRSRSTARSRQT